MGQVVGQAGGQAGNQPGYQTGDQAGSQVAGQAGIQAEGQAGSGGAVAVVDSAPDPLAADHIFIFNPRSFQRKADMDATIAAILAILKDIGISRYHVHVSRYPRDAIGVVNRYIKDMPGAIDAVGAAGTPRRVRVYAVGGDGILFDCLNAVMGIEGAELAAVPFGHENEFIRAFGDGAVDRFNDIRSQLLAPSIPTDVIYCNGNYALNYCTVGLESIAIMWRTGYMRRMNRLLSLFKILNKCVFWGSTLLCALKERKNRQVFFVTADGERLDGPYTTIHIANGPCHGMIMPPPGNVSPPSNVSPEGNVSPQGSASLPDDGLLELVMGYARSVSAIYRFLSDLGSGRRQSQKRKKKISVLSKQIREIRISSEMPLMINLDGEVFVDMSMDVKIMPKGMHFIAPEGLRYAPRPAKL